MRVLPSIAAMRTFVTAARTNSFAAAAEELCITPAAVSQQMKGLETLLNIKLFSRNGRSIRLTEAGSRWLPEVRNCLDTIERTVDLVTDYTKENLAITVAPSVASRWLMRRLYRFSEVEPDINVRVIATPEVVDLWDQDVDLAIRYGGGTYPGCKSVLMFPEYLIPACSPQHLERSPPINDPVDLQKHTLIHDESTMIRGGAWAYWFNVLGIKNVVPNVGPRFSLADLAIQNALDGRGVVLARWELICSEIQNGQLVCPINFRVESPFGYFAVVRPDMAQDKKVSSFVNWLTDESENRESLKIASELNIQTFGSD